MVVVIHFKSSNRYQKKATMNEEGVILVLRKGVLSIPLEFLANNKVEVLLAPAFARNKIVKDGEEINCNIGAESSSILNESKKRVETNQKG